jgi:hypothetical protein
VTTGGLFPLCLMKPHWQKSLKPMWRFDEPQEYFAGRG